MSDDPKIVVARIEGVSKEEEARLHLHAAAAVLHHLAADSHAKGMYLEGQSVRLEQLAEGLDDEDVLRIRDLMIQEGVIEVGEVPVESAAVPPVTAPGGEG